MVALIICTLAIFVLRSKTMRRNMYKCFEILINIHKDIHLCYNPVSR